jgi:pSer/pThr/pTyr-binding forkhead associated (FHA) protein
VGFLDRFRRGRRPAPYPGPSGGVAPTQRVSPAGATPPTEKIQTGGTLSSPLGAREPEIESEATLYAGGSGRVVGVLVGTGGRLENEVFRVFDGANKLGRADHCEVVLHSQRISREHAMLTHRDGSFRIEPLSDRNPTRVNGEPTRGGELADGDELGLGDSTFRFRSVG